MQLKDEIRTAMKEALREHLADNPPCHIICKLTEDDVAFFKRLKLFIDRVSSAVGLAVILAIVGALVWVMKVGIESWRAGTSRIP